MHSNEIAPEKAFFLSPSSSSPSLPIALSSSPTTTGLLLLLHLLLGISHVDLFITVASSEMPSSALLEGAWRTALYSPGLPVDWRRKSCSPS